MSDGENGSAEVSGTENGRAEMSGTENVTENETVLVSPPICCSALLGRTPLCILEFDFALVHFCILESDFVCATGANGKRHRTARLNMPRSSC